MWIDIIFAIVLLISFYRGYKKGLIKTIFTVLAILIALIITLKFSPNVIEIFEQSLKFGSTLAFISGTVVTFMLVYFAMTFLGNLLEKLIKTIHLNFINKIAGGVLGSLISMIFLSFILAFIDGFQLIPEIQKEASFCYDIMIQIPDITRMNMEKLKPFFEEFWDLARKAFAKD
jgi:membrane protein required for colicin V production